MKPRVLLAVAALSLVACQGEKPAPDTAKKEAEQNNANPASAKRDAYGEPLTRTGVAKVALSELVTHTAKYADKVVQVEGTVTAVCQTKGCWLELGDNSGAAHVKLGGHKFFVPKTSNGRRALVEAKVLPAVEDGHCEAEAAEQTGRAAKVELVATGVELLLSPLRPPSVWPSRGESSARR